MKRMVGEQQPRALRGRQPILHQSQIQVLVAAVDFVPHDRMPQVRKVNADLMLAPGAWNDAEQGERIVGLGRGAFRVAIGSRRVGGRRSGGTPKSSFDGKPGLRRRAIGSHAIFDHHPTVFVLPERRVNESGILPEVAMGDGEIFLRHGPGFPEVAQLARRRGGLGQDCDAAGFPIQTVDQVRSCRRPQIQADAADQAGIRATLGWMTDQPRWFVDHQQAIVFVQDLEKRLQSVVRVRATLAAR